MTVVNLAQATLRLESAGGVTAPETRGVGSVVLPSLPLARDVDGRPTVPATSIAGSLRQAVAPADRDGLFGHVTYTSPEKTRTAVSRLWVLGTRVTPSALTTERRRTAVDRHRAAAAAGALFDREALPAGSTIEVWLRLDDTPDQRGDIAIDDLLSRWRPRIGAGRSTGLGRAVVTQVRHVRLDLSDDGDLLRWLTTGGPALFDDVAPTPVTATDDDQRLFADEKFDGLLTFVVTDALHIGSGRRQNDDEGPRTALILRDGNQPIVPGSTWKGVLRSRVELVLRSVGSFGVCSSVSADGPCGTCPVCETFGWTARDLGDRTVVGARSRLAFLDSSVTGATVRTRNHVAIDRVFGGASRGLLFSEEVVVSGQVTCDLRWDGSFDAPPDGGPLGLDPLVRDALVLAFQDLAEGIAGIGAGTTRGNGTLTPDPLTARWLDREAPAARARLREAVDALEDV
ncbi:RAMP superfamily CRISPR-associated protein [Promicromonospora alba]|uniref:RAMP superfamily CRISPR-associated protein n=1 Tax=Promicromonospora alba TaxID=1616110 RepID=A0ABV9HDE5_9MICO